MKIQTKTTLLFTAITATVFLISTSAVYVFIDAFAHRDFNKRLELRTKLIANLRFNNDTNATKAFIELQKDYLETLPQEQATIIPVTSNGTLLEEPKEKISQKYLANVFQANGKTVFYQNQFRHYAGILYESGGIKYLVIKSATNEYGSMMMRQLRNMKVIAFILAVVLIYSIGYYFSKKTYRPIRDITNKAKEISKGNLHLRLKEQPGSDEIAELTATFNQMISRLETAFEAQNNFISHASHELRTPLTAIIGEADYALTKERTPEVYRTSLEQIVQQAEKLQSISKGLLSLAQTGFNGKTDAWKRIRIDQLLYDVKEDCEALSPVNKVVLELNNLPEDADNISIEGNYDLLKVAINNVVLNACKYSAQQPVFVKLTNYYDSLSITISDKGIGIPQEELKYIYDPFFRASNTKEFKGYGIGMPLARNIISIHHGKIEVDSKQNIGTIVRIHLPKRS